MQILVSKVDIADNEVNVFSLSYIFRISLLGFPVLTPNYFLSLSYMKLKYQSNTFVLVEVGNYCITHKNLLDVLHQFLNYISILMRCVFWKYEVFFIMKISSLVSYNIQSMFFWRFDKHCVIQNMFVLNIKIFLFVLISAVFQICSI